MVLAPTIHQQQQTLVKGCSNSTTEKFLKPQLDSSKQKTSPYKTCRSKTKYSNLINKKTNSVTALYQKTTHPKRKRRKRQKSIIPCVEVFMSASENPIVPPPVVPSHLRPVSLDLERTGGKKMGYHTGLIVGGCYPPGGGGTGAHLSRQDVMTYSHYVHGSIFSVPKSWQIDNGENLVVSVYSFLKTFLGASGSNQGAIDNRIEQAMDLVKSHLMNAVRSEVEELKEKIIKLEEIISQLQSENEFLRANVHRDVLLQLQQQQQLQIQQQQSLGSPPTQPALPQTPQLN